MKLLDKLTNVVGALLGTIQLAIPIIKEALVDVARICNIIFFWTDFDDTIIAKINQIFDMVEGWFEMLKDLWLAVGK